MIESNDMPDCEIILASNSPRRRALLTEAGWQFAVRPVDIDESPLTGEDPQGYVRRLAETKARAAGAQLDALAGRVILAADTTVADGADILGKPGGATEAAAMLLRLRGRTHAVYTALALYLPDRDVLYADVCSSAVSMRDYSNEEMQAYIAGGDPLDKAGAYAIQHSGFHPVERLEGCYANVVGLPLCRLNLLFSQAGLPAQPGIPLGCSDHRTCSICTRLAGGEDAR